MAALFGDATSYAVGAIAGANTMLVPGAPGCRTDVHSVAGNPKLDLFDSGSVELPPLTRRAGAGEASLALRREAYVGAGRHGADGVAPSSARAAFDIQTTLYLHTTKNLAQRAPSIERRVWTSRRRRSPGTSARPASESSDDCWPAQARWTTTSLGPPNCHTEQWSLPPSRTRSIPPAKSGLPLGRTRFLNSQRARVARRNPPRVIGKPGSLPSLCLLGGHDLCRVYV